MNLLAFVLQHATQYFARGPFLAIISRDAGPFRFGQGPQSLQGYATGRSQAEGVDRLDVRFTQRQLREALTWPDRALRRQLSRLVELEYVLVYRTGRGNQRAYQLLYDGQATAAASGLLGLTDAKRLSKNQNRPPRKAASTIPR